MTSGKNGLPHESFNFIEIKINDSQYAYYNKFSSSFISIDINGYVYNKYSNNILNIPPDCIFNKFVLFKGDAKDSCHSCSSTIMTDNQTKINRYIKNLSVEKDFIKKKSEVDSLNQNIFINYNNNYSDPQKHFIKFKLNNGSSSQTYRTMDISIPDEKELNNLFKSKKQYNKNTIKSLYEYKKYTTEFADEIKDFDKFYLDSFIISINNDKNYVLIVKCIKSIDETKKYLVRFLDYNSEILYNAQQSPQ